jgi:hypothetical protein
MARDLASGHDEDWKRAMEKRIKDDIDNYL